MTKSVCNNEACETTVSRMNLLSPASGYYLDREWYCSLSCLKQALISTVRQDLSFPSLRENRVRRGLIGAMLLEKRLITQDELDEALLRQRGEGGALGMWILRLTAVTEEELTAVLSEQQGVPWLGGIHFKLRKEQAGVIPKALCLNYQVAPFELNKGAGLLLVAAKSPIRLSLIHVFRKMSSYRVKVFIVPDELFDSVSDEYLSECVRSTVEELSLSRARPGEVCELMVSRLQKQGAYQMSLVFFDGFFWVRFSKRDVWKDLFIRLPEGQKLFPPETGKNLPKSGTRGLKGQG